MFYHYYAPDPGNERGGKMVRVGGVEGRQLFIGLVPDNERESEKDILLP